MVSAEPPKPAAAPSGNQEASANVSKSPEARNAVSNPKAIAILVIGSRGCGKTSFINMAGPGQTKPISSGPSLCTTKVDGVLMTVGSRQFVLIDSPGLDNMSMSDCDIFVNIMRYLAPSPSQTTHRKITGVIYIHAGDSLGSGTLARNLHTLMAILGEKYIYRIAVLFKYHKEMDPEGVSRFLLKRKSAFQPLNGAHFQMFPSNKQQVHNLLLDYAPYEPEFTAAQIKIAAGQLTDIRSFVEDGLQRIEKKALVNQPENHKKIQTVDKKEEQLRQSEADSTTDTKSLRERLQKIQQEYASLRSNLQVEENIPPGEIVQRLGDLNHAIEDLGRTVSEYLTETYPTVNATTSEAFQIHSLKRMFNHAEGKSSLAQSSTGDGMKMSHFFDYAVRTVLCKQFCEHIFHPIHPGVAEHKTDFIRDIYKRIQLQETQAVAGRWRSNTFKSISDQEDTVQSDQFKNWLTTKITVDHFNPLLTCFFGNEPVNLEEKHNTLLKELVSSAYDLNKWLKGSIVLLGDFEVLAYPARYTFDGNKMAEFESKPGAKSPEYILSTIGLGISRILASGGGKEPEVTFLCKAKVTSETLYK